MNCEACGLPQRVCFCAQLVPIAPQAHFGVLTCHKELERRSNTGRLLKQLLPLHSEIVPWARTQPPTDWLASMQQHPNAYLVFPADPERDAERSVSQVSGHYPLFVLLDGTWQEARKMARKSPYLAHLPLLSLSPDQPSRYPLRARQKPGALCTLEAAAECLRLAQDDASADHLLQSFALFLRHYQAGLSGHAVKPVPDPYNSGEVRFLA
ncbi:MAG: tRNA-uridine aminocarboxypropyltransferase [Candidatus Sericytochromatia bacterium]